MKKRLVGLLVVAAMSACVPRAFALSAGFTVTKATQVEQGLDFTLSAVRASETAVLVRMEIPREGKLKDLKSVKMRIGAEPLVWADLQTTAGKDGALVVGFQLAPALADKCSIDLMTTSLDGVYYSIELKGYITDKK